ncbi:MAG TPA: nucleotidyltransferase family protein [Candidatus Acidoferrales bacterium]|nr:nucleotidyltransferase family protein [Candidatus Acidoferrales bacterium]
MADRCNEKSAEMQLLATCAREQLNDAERSRLSELVAGKLDWALLLRLADEDGLLPLLHKHLVDADARIPPDVMKEISEQSRENAMRGLFLTAELLRVLDKFRERDIQAVPYKGPVLAARAYGSPTLRQFDDLDIVTPQGFMPAVYDAMESLDYQARLSRQRFTATDPRAIPGEYVFVHKTHRAMVELHTEHTLRHFPVRPDIEGMIRRAVSVRMDGKDVPAFAAEDTLLMLAVHGAKDFWGRLIWVADVAEIVKQTPGIDWQVLIAEAKRLKVTRMLNLAFSLAHEILDLEIPPEIVEQVESDETAKLLTRQLSKQLMSGETAANGVVQRSLYRIRMTGGLWDGIRYWARLSTAPAEEDWEMTDVPKRFSRSYVFLRPFRLWKKYAQRGSREG